MSRPKLSPLSSLLPSKGEATRPEVVATPLHQASNIADKVRPVSYKEGPRSAVSFRMTESLQERLREYAFRSRRRKQDVLDDALHEFLDRAGF